MCRDGPCVITDLSFYVIFIPVVIPLLFHSFIFRMSLVQFNMFRFLIKSPSLSSETWVEGEKVVVSERV